MKAITKLEHEKRYHIAMIQFECAISIRKTKQQNIQEDSKYAKTKYSKVSAINVFAVKYFDYDKISDILYFNKSLI